MLHVLPVQRGSCCHIPLPQWQVFPGDVHIEPPMWAHACMPQPLHSGLHSGGLEQLDLGGGHSNLLLHPVLSSVFHIYL